MVNIIKNPFSLILVVLFLAACTDHRSTKESKSVETSQQLHEALDKASKINDPWKAYETLESGSSELLYECTDNELIKRVTQTTLGYLQHAVELENLDAIRYLYREHFSRNDSMLELQHLLAPTVLEVAEKLTGVTPEERQVLVIAGDIARNGQFVIRNSKGATALYAKAWAMKDVKAAQHAAILFSDLRDPANAYLWALRCTGACHRERGITLTELEALLPPALIEQIQQMARNQSIVEVPAHHGAI